MRKRKESSTRSERVLTTTDEQYVSPYGSPETLEHMKQCEAREWIRRHKAKIGELGSVNAQSWWAGVVADIERIRGPEAVMDLRRRMNDERKLSKQP